MYNLTDTQKNLLRWFVRQVRDGKLEESFDTVKIQGDFFIPSLPQGIKEPKITEGILDALVKDELLICKRLSGGITCTLIGKAYEAVDSDFGAPDTSFLKHLTPLPDISGFDQELKERCLPNLGAGNDPKNWDNAVRTACVVLEKRLRDIGGISDPSVVGIELVNKVFGDKGTLANKFAQSSERQGYRDVYAGVFGVFRNPIAHHFKDPLPEDGGAIITFINLLLKMLEDLRPTSGS